MKVFGVAAFWLTLVENGETTRQLLTTSLCRGISWRSEGLSGAFMIIIDIGK